MTKLAAKYKSLANFIYVLKKTVEILLFILWKKLRQ